MRQPHHRELGPALTLLDSDPVVVELINDGKHVHPVLCRIVAGVAGSGRLALISDGVAATAAPDGHYRRGGSTSAARAGGWRPRTGVHSAAG